MEEIKTNAWSSILEAVKLKINRQSFETWFKKSSQVSFNNNALVVKLPSPFHCEWLEEKYGVLIKSIFEDVCGSGNTIVFINNNTKQNLSIKIRPAVSSLNMKNNINPSFNFESFVVGNSNRFAHSACLAVAEAPSKTKFNPLLIYGGTGLGKT
ncbi:MAG: DnaA/Hda family protein, partial [bacterium]